MTQPLDQVSRDWADAKRREREEIEDAMRQHRLRTARHPGQTRSEWEAQQALRRAAWVVTVSVTLFVLAVGWAYWMLHCPGLAAVGC